LSMYSRRRFIKDLAVGGAAVPLGRAPGTWSPDKVGTSKADLREIVGAREGADEERFWRLVRRQFPLTRDRAYFNTSGLGASPRLVVDTIMQETLKLETISETGHEQVKAVTEKIARFFNVDPEEIAITRNTTEGMNIFAREVPLEKGDEVLLSRQEHPGAFIPWLAVMKDKGILLNVYDPDSRNAARNLDIIERHLTPRTKVVSIDHIPCTTGTVYPAKQIVELCRSRGIIIGIDGAHPPGQMPVDLRDLDPDFYALSGHKWLFGPKGTGILFINKKIIGRLNPVFAGAYCETTADLDKRILEYKLEANRIEYGTRGTAVVLGLGAALDFIMTLGVDRIHRRGRQLAEFLKNELVKIPQVDLLTPLDPTCSAAIVTFELKGRPYSDVQRRLQKEHNCRVRGIFEGGLNAVRVSCAVYNSFEELEKLIEGVRRIAGS
jgi:selenocysteine lyase/cysteine desulfurase